MDKKVRYGIITIVIIGITLYIFAFRNPLKQNPQRILIRNGTTGVETILIDHDKEEFMDKLREIDSRLSGIHLWTSGYQYIIYFEGNLRTKDITVRGNNSFVSGMMEYTTSSDIISIIEEFATTKD